MRTSYCACDANARRGRVRRCDALRDGDEVLGRGGNERETPETAGHAPRRSRGAPGRAATRGTPAPGGGTPRVPTPGTVTDHPTPSRSTSAARGTRVAPNEEASSHRIFFGKFVKLYAVSHALRRFQFRAHNDADDELPHPRQVQTGLDEPQECHHRRWLEVRPSRDHECHETRRPIHGHETRCPLSPSTRRPRILTVFLRARSRAHRHAIVARKRARPALTQPASSPFPEPQGEGPQGHEGRVPRRHGRRSAAAGASPPRSERAKRAKRSVLAPRLIRANAFAFRPPRRFAIAVSFGRARRPKKTHRFAFFTKKKKCRR